MAVRIKVSRDFKLDAESLLTEQDMRDVGDLQVRKIRTRTEAGIDDKGAVFRPYSALYASQKAKALGHSRVDLTVSGRMLNDMQVTEATNTTVTLSFISQGGGGGGGTFIQRSSSMGAADKAAFNDPKRNFFGVSDEEADEIAELLDERIQKRFDAME